MPAAYAHARVLSALQLSCRAPGLPAGTTRRTSRHCSASWCSRCCHRWATGPRGQGVVDARQAPCPAPTHRTELHMPSLRPCTHPTPPHPTCAAGLDLPVRPAGAQSAPPRLGQDGAAAVRGVGPAGLHSGQLAGQPLLGADRTWSSASSLHGRLVASLNSTCWLHFHLHNLLLAPHVAWPADNAQARA